MMETSTTATRPIHDGVGATDATMEEGEPTSPPRVVSHCGGERGDGDGEGGPPATATEAEVAPAEPAICITGRFRNIDDRYLVDPSRVLGSGHHGSVRSCVDLRTGSRRAVKSVRKRRGDGCDGCDGDDGDGRGTTTTTTPAGIAREVVLLEGMDHDGVIRLVDVFEDAECVHIVTELYGGGELFDRIVERNAEHAEGGAQGGTPCFDEGEAADVVRRLLEAVAYLHAMDVVHRDVKPENVLFETAEAGSPTKLIDFGLSRRHRPDDAPMTTVVGTSYYLAPEVLRRRYDRSCDLWSVGIVLYVLLCGYPPFNGGTQGEVFRSVLRSRLRFPREEWEDVSDGALDLVRSLLRRDPRERPTAEEALRHPWLRRSRGGDADERTDEVPAAAAPTAEAPAIHEAEERQDLSSVEIVYRANVPSRPPTATAALAGGGFKRVRSPPRSPERKVRMSMFAF